MKAKPQPKQSMQEEQIRTALNAHWEASAAGDANLEHDIYDDDAICDYPQSGERILGRKNLQVLRSHHPGKPSGFEVKRMLGNGDLWITEYTITYQGRLAYTVSIMEFRNGKVVHETQYFADPFEAPAWRRQWVQQNGVLKDRLSRYREITLTVTGRTSGRTISIPVWFVVDGETLYLLPVQGSDTQWYKNVLKNPMIRIAARGAEGEFKVVPVTDAKQVSSVVEKFRAKYGASDVKKYYSKFDVAVVAPMR